MSPGKKRLQRIGSWVVRQVSSTKVPDTTSGFRAYTREAALRLTIVSEFSYTLESIIHAGKKRIAVTHVPVATNPRTRESRLFGSVWTYLKASAATIVRIYAMYEPLKVFSFIGLVIFTAGFAISVRFLYYYVTGAGLGHLQSLILSAVLLIVGFQVGADRAGCRRHLGQPEADRGCAVSGQTLELDRHQERTARTRIQAKGATGREDAWRLRSRFPSSSRRSTRARPSPGSSRRSGTRRRGGRSSSWTTGPPTERTRRRAAAGATVIRHPYNKGNGAAVKTGIRAAARRVRPDHRRRRPASPGDAVATRRAGSASTISSSARAPARRRPPRPAASATAC